MKKVSLVGFGKIGQALGAHILKRCPETTLQAIDISEALKKSFQDGTFETNEPQAGDILIEAYKAGRLKVETDFATIRGSEAVLVAIPLYVNDRKEPDLRTFVSCLREIGPHLANNCLLSVETTIPVGTCRNLFVAELKKIGIEHGRDYRLVHSPERIKSGSMMKQLTTVAKVVGGVDDSALQLGLEVYRRIMGPELVHAVSSIEAAELIKLAGMVYRDVNIALSNQIADFCTKGGWNVEEVIRWSNTDGEAHLLIPGIGVGGHCTPVYPYFLIENFKTQGLNFTLAAEGRRINDLASEKAVVRTLETVPFKKALVLGLGFRPDVPEDAYSTTYLVVEALKKRNIDVRVYDPYFPKEFFEKRGLVRCEDPYAWNAEAAFLVTPHAEFKQLDWKRLASGGLKVLFDGRNAYARTAIESAGLKYLGIGR